MSEKEFEAVLKDMLDLVTDSDLMDEIDVDVPVDIRNIRTFEDSGLFTNNSGLVINMRDGSQYQLTIVKSR